MNNNERIEARYIGPEVKTEIKWNDTVTSEAMLEANRRLLRFDPIPIEDYAKKRGITELAALVKYKECYEITLARVRQAREDGGSCLYLSAAEWAEQARKFSAMIQHYERWSVVVAAWTKQDKENLYASMNVN